MDREKLRVLLEALLGGEITVGEAMEAFRRLPYDDLGLVLAIFTALVGFLFAAPGAVVIQGFGSARQNGRISAAGPAVNLAVGGSFAFAWFLLTLTGLNFGIGMAITLTDLVAGVAFINLLLGTFNMIPFPPLDGSKIVRWDLRTYVLLLIPLAALTVLGFLFFSPFG